jgi:hypothetical protein
MSIITAPFSYDYVTFDEVFHSEASQGFGWARETVDVTGTKAGIYQIGTLVVLSDDRTKATIPASFDDLNGAKAGTIAILARKNIPTNVIPQGATLDDIRNNFNPDILALTDSALTKKHVVIVDGRNGGAIGDAQIGFPTGTTKEQKQTIFTRLKAENGFKVLKQAVRG